MDPGLTILGLLRPNSLEAFTIFNPRNLLVPESVSGPGPRRPRWVRAEGEEKRGLVLANPQPIFNLQAMASRGSLFGVGSREPLGQEIPPTPGGRCLGTRAEHGSVGAGLSSERKFLAPAC
jgi:hypothetical protein